MSQVFDDMMQGLEEVRQFMDGKREGFKVYVPEAIDVRGIRGKLHMSQKRFAGTFGFSVDAVRHWEANRRTPEAPARAFLKVIDLHPQMVMKALATTNAQQPPKP